MQEMDIDRFIEQGYILIPKDQLASCSSTENADQFVSDIFNIRREIKRFFERPQADKAPFLNGHARDLETNCHPAGWWKKSTFGDHYEGVEFPLEYYVSRNFYGSTPDDICRPRNDSEKTREIAASLPGPEVFSLAKFLEEQFITPVLRAYSLECGLQPPSPSLQIQITHYDATTSLATHRDPGFLEGIVGPATGLAIYPAGGVEKLDSSLEAGDLILYTGFEFQHYYSQRTPKVPPPLPHAIEAEAGRMSILISTLMPLE